MELTATAHCSYCHNIIHQQAPGMPWFDTWYDPRVAVICPRRLHHGLPHEPGSAQEGENTQ